MIQAGPICIWCKHFVARDDRDEADVIAGRIVCKAFLQGIPAEILDNIFDHREPHPRDNGFQFELKEGSKLDLVPLPSV